jgi:predicted nucleic acid-binding protein
MSSTLLLDTDVLIDFLRGQNQAIRFFETISERPLVSVISVSELFAGVRDGAEREVLEILLRGMEVIYVTEAIAVRGGFLRREYGKSHNVGLFDALIAATSEIVRARLVTLNRKHFPMLTDIQVPYHKT